MNHLVDFCRLCLCFKGEFSNMCNDNIMEKVVACFSDLEFDDQLPALICTKCSEQLDMFFDFRNQCLRSEFLLNCYIAKFPCSTQSCNKFINTQLKVNVLKNFAPSSKLQSNVQLFKKRVFDNNSKNLKICESEIKLNISKQHEVIQPNDSLTLSKPSANTRVIDNDINTYLSDTILCEDEDDVFLEEEDDETIQLENVNTNNETEKGKRKSGNSGNSRNKKSKLERNPQFMNNESSTTKQTNQAESDCVNNLVNDANCVPFNMQGDITEHVKLRKRQVQIRAQEKIQQALNDKLQINGKKPGNLLKGTSLYHKRKSPNGKTGNIKNAKLINSRRHPQSSNNEMNQLGNMTLKTSSNSTSAYNINVDECRSDGLQNFSDRPVIHTTNLDKLVDLKLKNIVNNRVTTNTVSDELKNLKLYSLLIKPVTPNSATQNEEENQIKDAELQNLETNSTFMTQNMEKDKLKTIGTTQDTEEETSLVFISHNSGPNLSQNLNYIPTYQGKFTESQNLGSSSLSPVQPMKSNIMMQNIRLDPVKKSKVLDIQTSPSKEPDHIQDAKSQILQGVTDTTKVDKIGNTESLNLNRDPVLQNNETHKSQNSNHDSILHNIDIDKARNVIEQKIKNNPAIINKAGKLIGIKLQNSKRRLEANNINTPPGIKTDMDYEKDITPYCIPTTLSPSKEEISKPKHPQTSFGITNRSIIEKGSKRLQRVIIPKQTWRNVYQGKGTRNNSSPKSLLNGKGRTILTPSCPGGSIIKRKMLSLTSFTDNQTLVQNPQGLSVTDINPPNLTYSGMAPQNTNRISVKPIYLLVNPTQDITMHQEEPVPRNKPLKTSRSLLKSKINGNPFKVNEPSVLDKEKFQASVNDTLNVGANVTLPLNSKDILYNTSPLNNGNNHLSLLRSNNEVSLFRISNGESIESSNIRITDVRSLAENTVVTVATQLPTKTRIKVTIKSEPDQDIKLEPKSEDYVSSTTDASLVEGNFPAPHEDHNYYSS